ncbi:potassium-transporting ATPase subunit F [Sphingobacterium sp. C459-1T]|uniref:Potassium-transporting ATPase subunit F n=1 Tax=Sphingobacterium faecale TaxID=2803775 RepID=A0ABS1QYJ7_9SPHI|nr:potassium-transporting ATPase subunit F [Sphingobacterium faecale]
MSARTMGVSLCRYSCTVAAYLSTADCRELNSKIKTMIILFIAAIAVFAYIAYVLLNPEKF